MENEHLKLNRKSTAKKFIFGSLGLVGINFLIGLYQTPARALIDASEKGMTEASIKFGYALGILSIIVLPLPLIVSFLSLAFKSRRSIASFSKIFFWCLCLTLILNVILNYALVPSVINEIKF